MSVIRVALIGLDHWYSALPLADGIAAHDAVSLAGVWDADADRARDVATRYGVARVESDWRTLVDDTGIDAVMSFVSVDLNHVVCLAAARAGKHIVANKPLARRMQDASDVVSAVRGSGVHLLPAESRQRLGPRTRLLRQWVDEGRIGRPTHALMTTWAGLPQRWSGDPEPGWFADPSRTLGGGWADHAVYQIDTLRWILGEEIVAVAGQVANLRYPALAVEDYGVATVTFSGGTVATLENTWTAPDGMFQSSCTLVGSDGAVRMDGILERVLVLADLAPLTGWVEMTPPPKHDQAGDIDHWIAVLRGEAAPVATVEDAWHNVAACVAFYEAVRTGYTQKPREAPV